MEDEDAGSPQPSTQLVRARHAFAGKNNDELCFRRNDIIVITQCPEGGWWEGTLEGKTGWFPANFVAPYNPASGAPSSSRSRSRSPTAGMSVRQPVDPAVVEAALNKAEATDGKRYVAFRTMIVNDIIASERSHVQELRTLQDDYLLPLQKAESVLTEEEHRRISCNIDALIDCQERLLKSLENTASKVVAEQRVGGDFMAIASTMRNLLQDYCSNHPLAAKILTDKRDELSEFVSAQNGGKFIALVQGLSRPFRRLERYPNYLMELERVLEESDPDRGDTQRAIAVYREMVEFCTEVRKDKEVQLELLSGSVEGWRGAPIDCINDIVLQSNVTVSALTSDPEDRCLVLTHDSLLFFATSAALDKYIFKLRCPLAGLQVKRPDSSSHCLQLCGSDIGISPLSITFKDARDFNRWIEALQQNSEVKCHESCSVIAPASEPHKVQAEPSRVSPARQVEISTMPTPGKASLKPSNQLVPSASTSAVNTATPPQNIPTPASMMNLTGGGGRSPQQQMVNGHSHTTTTKSGLSFRPLPPAQGHFLTDANNVRLRRPDVGHDHEDAQLLKIVEAYFGGPSASGPMQVRSAGDARPVLVAEDEKIFVEELVNGELVVQERTLVDTVYSLKDTLEALGKKVDTMQKTLDKEQRARRRLEELVRRRSSQAGAKSPVTVSAV